MKKYTLRKLGKKLLPVAFGITAAGATSLATDAQANTSNTYTVNNNVKTYSNAANAAKSANAKSTYGQGTYHIYKQANGMINISKTPGKAGAWINPSENKVAPTPVTKTNQTTKPATQPVQTAGKQYVLNTSVKTYTNASSAASQTNARSTYAKGNYYIYKTVNGMMNISRLQGKAGAWINPAENKLVAAESIPTPQKTQNSSITTQTNLLTDSKSTTTSTYILNSKTNVYSNSKDASNKQNSKTSYTEGTYYIYKKHNGMINISKIMGRPGAWIHPEKPVITARKINSLPSSKNITEEELNKMKNEYIKFFGNIGGQRSIYITPADGNEFFEMNSSNLQPSASSIKLFILAAAYNKSYNGTFNLNTKYTVKASDISKGSFFTENLIGKTHTMDQYIRFMMEKSDNGATNILIRHLGGINSVQNEIRKLGYTKTTLNHYMNDSKAINAGKVNYITAQESADLMKRIYNKTLISTHTDSIMLDKLSRNHWNEWLTANIRNQAKTWNKPGGNPSLPINNDTAVIKVNNKAYIISTLNNYARNAHTAAAKFGQSIVNILKR